MQKKFNKLWVFGGSHSTVGICVNPQESFWALAANELQTKYVVNCSRGKMSFDSVCQILIGEQLRYDFEKDFFLIGLPPLERITVFDNHQDTALQATEFDTNTWSMNNFNLLSHHGLINMQYHELDKIMIIIQDRSWLETQTLRQIFLLTQWLDRHQANYLIVNHSKNLDANNRWGPSEFVLDYCLKHQRCVLFDQSLYNVNLNINRPVDFAKYGWQGHHGPDGNKLFFEKSIKPKLC